MKPEKWSLEWKTWSSSVHEVLEVARYQLCHEVFLHAAGPSWGALGLLTGSLVPHTLCGGNNRAKWKTQHWQVPPGDSDMSAVVIKTKHLDQDTAFPWIFFFKSGFAVSQVQNKKLRQNTLFCWSHIIPQFEWDEDSQGCGTRNSPDNQGSTKGNYYHVKNM